MENTEMENTLTALVMEIRKIFKYELNTKYFLTLTRLHSDSKTYVSLASSVIERHWKFQEPLRNGFGSVIADNSCSTPRTQTMQTIVLRAINQIFQSSQKYFAAASIG